MLFLDISEFYKYELLFRLRFENPELLELQALRGTADAQTVYKRLPISAYFHIVPKYVIFVILVYERKFAF